MLSKLWGSWQRVLFFVQPATLIGWHRRLFKFYWTRKTRNTKKPGRPKVSKEVQQLIARMTRENRRPGMAVGRFRRHDVPRSPKDAKEEAQRNITWGAPRIVKEMALLGHVMSESAVHRYGGNRKYLNGSCYARHMYLEDGREYEYHCKHFGTPPSTFGYKDMIPLFKVEKFDAEEWADLFRRSGAKFAGPVAAHHDNFAMCKSSINPWNAAAMGPCRDVTGELARAIRAKGRKFITTFHNAYNWWFFPKSEAFDGVAKLLAPTVATWFSRISTDSGRLEHPPPP